ncbi:MAG: helicase HerA-like domain-containing protein [Oscillospiraceae bacterium]
MVVNNELLIAQTAQGEEIFMHAGMANRHGLIAGATGTGKTISLKVLAESFSDIGVPVFLADIKGDLSGFAEAGGASKPVDKRVAQMGLESKGFVKKSYPVQYWDVFGENGIPVRTTISEMGPVLLARILGLNDTQTSVLNVVFQIADDNQLLLIDTKDLKSMLKFVSDNNKSLMTEYGNIAPQSVAAIVRAVVALEGQGGREFFGEPSLDVKEWFRTSTDSRGVINILDCVKLSQNPVMYGTFMLWMLSELYENLPEIGDCEKPRMVFFFDEAHLLFSGASKALLEKVTQVVRLIRSKGVGVFFITQSPADIPDSTLAQLGNKIQHALRAYTPTEKKALKAAADSYRENPAFNTAEAIAELGTGEAVISFLNTDGSPMVVQRAFVLPPQSNVSPIDPAKRQSEILRSDLYLRYKDMIDRRSAYEVLADHNAAVEQQALQAAEEAQRLKQEQAEEAQRAKAQQKELERQRKEAEKAAAAAEREQQRKLNSLKNTAVRGVSSVAADLLIGGKIGKGTQKSIVRGILGTFLK